MNADVYEVLSKIGPALDGAIPDDAQWNGKTALTLHSLWSVRQTPKRSMQPYRQLVTMSGLLTTQAPVPKRSANCWATWGDYEPGNTSSRHGSMLFLSPI